MPRILLGVTGGISAYKALEFARLATKSGHGVRVLMTEGAKRFVGPASFEGITGAPVLTSEFETDPMRGAFPGDDPPTHDPIGHLEVAANADVFIVAPASANTIAKLATGMADSILATSFLACTAPRIVAPAMNDRMYANAATQANLAILTGRGVTVLDPGEGHLASRGEHGKGRLPEPEELLAAVEAALPAGERPWDGLRVLVTAGGTREAIDPVRFVGNRSSGRMGFALAAAAAGRGAEVTLVAANVGLPTPTGVARRIDVVSTADLSEATKREFDRAHVLLMAAAPADFTPRAVAPEKIRRSADLALELEPTTDILASLEPRRTWQTVVGFAAETAKDGIESARSKLARKGADMIVLNDVSNPEIGFESERNAVTLVTAAGEAHVPIAPKEQIAEAILAGVDGLRRTRDAQPSAGTDPAVPPA